MVVGDEREFSLANTAGLLEGFISSARLRAPSICFSSERTAPKNLETMVH